MFGIIRTSRPTWILAENVAGHVTLGLDQVLADLESEDYAVQPIIVPACAVDAPHRRDRVWIIANAENKRGCRKNEYEECFKQDREEWFQRQPRRDSSIKFVPDSDNARRVKQWRTKSIQSELVTAECGNRWSAEPDVRRVAYGIPRRVDRLRGLGNAIVPQVAYEIIKAMIEADESA